MQNFFFQIITTTQLDRIFAETFPEQTKNKQEIMKSESW